MEKYFAAKSARELVRHLTENKDAYYTNIGRQGLRDRWRKSYNLYFGKHFDIAANNSSSILRTGARGELAAFAVNHYRNLIKHTLVMTTNQKPSFDVRAVNTDPNALDQAKLGNQILESDYKFKHLGYLLKQSAERAQVFGKGFMFSLWNEMRGEPYAAKPVMGDDGQPVLEEDGTPKHRIIYEGDIMDRVPSPYDVFVDQGLEEWEEKEWVDVRVYENKYTIAAQFPHLAEQIVALPGKTEIDLLKNQLFNQTDSLSDLIPVYYFIHKSTPALPRGRLVMYLNEDLVLEDKSAPRPYSRTLPVFRIVPGEIFGTTEGWSDAFDLQGIQEAVNILVSIGFTNTQANGVQKLWVPEGANISSSTLSKGLAIIRSAQGMKPEPLQMTANPGDLYTQLQFLIKQAETTSGINSVSRGDPDHSLKSGVALAYVQSMAAQYTSAFQESWAKLNEEVASFRISLYQQNATTERIVELTGKRNLGYTASFTKDKLSKIRRVVVDMGNPVTKTLGGRLEVANNLKEMGFFKTPQDYVTFLESGQWNVLTEDSYDQLSSIHQENDALMTGAPVQAIPGDAHLLHAQKHYALCSNPAVRMNSPVVQRVLAHIQEHVNLWKTQDPVFSMISGEPPAPMPVPPPMPPGPPPPGGPKVGGKSGEQVAKAMQQPPIQEHIERLPEQLQPENIQQNM